MKIITTMKRQFGASMIETLMVFPIMLMMGLGVVHLGLVYQAKANLEYAALMAARAGSITSININDMLGELVRRMGPSQIGPNAPALADFTIQIMNPTVAMFQQCGEEPQDITGCVTSASCEIPNYGLQFRPAIAVCDGASIQDANLLRIKVTYRFNSRIPFMNVRLFASDDENQINRGLPENGIDITAVATVRMQTPARYTINNSCCF